jgi:hypothetical protein
LYLGHIKNEIIIKRYADRQQGGTTYPPEKTWWAQKMKKKE